MLRLLAALVLLGLGGLGTWLVLRNTAEVATRTPPPAKVVVAKVERKEVVEAIALPGRIRAAQAISLSSEISGLLVELAVAEGNHVEQGTLVARLDDALQQAALREAELALAEAKRELALARTLQERNIGSAERIAQLEAIVAASDARVDAAQISVNKSRIHAPFSGRLGLRRVDAGSWVAAGTPIIELTNLDPVECIIAVPAMHLARLRSGLDVLATHPSAPDRSFPGTLRVIDARIDPATATATCVAEFANSDGFLRPGLVVDTQIITARRDGLRIPEAAIELRAGTAVVYKVAQDTARRQSVDIGARGAGWVEITKGLDADDEIVIRGLQSLFLPEVAVIVDRGE